MDWRVELITFLFHPLRVIINLRVVEHLAQPDGSMGRVAGAAVRLGIHFNEGPMLPDWFQIASSTGLPLVARGRPAQHLQGPAQHDHQHCCPSF